MGDMSKWKKDRPGKTEEQPCGTCGGATMVDLPGAPRSECPTCHGSGVKE